jgi:hypothetical protein
VSEPVCDELCVKHIQNAERWEFLPLVHPMDLCAIAMGTQTPQDFRRGIEDAVDKIIAMAKQARKE